MATEMLNPMLSRLIRLETKMFKLCTAHGVKWVHVDAVPITGATEDMIINKLREIESKLDALALVNAFTGDIKNATN